MTKMKLKKGSALLLTLFIVSAIIVVALGSSYFVMIGLRSGNLQYDSSRAYYVAETGSERVLNEVRKNGFNLREAPFGEIYNIIIPDMALNNEASYSISNVSWNPIKLISVGTYGRTKRSVELEF